MQWQIFQIRQLCIHTQCSIILACHWWYKLFVHWWMKGIYFTSFYFRAWDCTREIRENKNPAKISTYTALQKNVIIFFLGNQISKWRSFEKRAIFDLLFTFFSHRGKVTKIPSAHISHTHIHTCILLTLLTLFALPILKKKKMNLSGMISLWYESWCWFLFVPFWNNQ